MPNPSSILTVIADNPSLLAAVKQTILKQFNVDIIDPTLPIEQIGQRVLARLEGVKAVELAFKEIANYKTIKEKPPTPNPAR